MKYKKTLAELEKEAVKWWPKHLEAEVANSSVIPKLLETQDQFISVLKLAGARPEQIFDLIAAGAMPANLFLKHLVVLSDFGGELIKRLGAEFIKTFPVDAKTKHHYMSFTFNGENRRYKFKALPVKGLSNPKLGIDGAAIVFPRNLDDLQTDVIMLLLYGGSSTSGHLASLERCELGLLLGNPVEIDKYVREKYIHVSRITTGASANSLGQIAQIHVAEFLRRNLAASYKVQSNGKCQLKGYDSVGGMPFDIVVKRKDRFVGVEVSFQVTSNSVIERKAALAESRRALMHGEGGFIAYVLDGAGNFSRRAALTTLCQSSDCTVAYSDKELNVLVDFIRGKLDDAVR